MESKLSGREEHKLQIEKSVLTKVNPYPAIIKEYYLYLRTYSSSTKRTYIEKLLQFLSWCVETHKINDYTVEEIKKIKAIDLDEFFYSRTFNEQNRIKGSTQVVIFSAVNVFYEFLKQRKYIQENPIEEVKRPRVLKQNLALSLSKEDIQSILHSIDNGVGSAKAKGYQKAYKNRDKLLFLLPLTTGIRVSALSEIDISKIDFTNHTISVIEKREKSRLFEISDEVFEILLQWMIDRERIVDGTPIDALFLTKRGGDIHRISVRSIQRIIEKYSADIDIKLSPHKLRRSYGTQYYRLSGNDIIATAQELGHEQLETTQRYIEPDASVHREVKKKMSEYIWGE